MVSLFSGLRRKVFLLIDGAPAVENENEVGCSGAKSQLRHKPAPELLIFLLLDVIHSANRKLFRAADDLRFTRFQLRHKNFLFSHETLKAWRDQTFVCFPRSPFRKDVNSGLTSDQAIGRRLNFIRNQ
jgi:hypothetical protein